MNKQDFYYLGKIVSKYSFKGELLLKTESDEINFKELKSIFIGIDGSLVPFEINRLQLHKSPFKIYPLRELIVKQKQTKFLKVKFFFQLMTCLLYREINFIITK